MDDPRVKEEILRLLESIKDDWYLPAHLFGTLKCDEEVGLDALATLEVEGRVESYEFEDAVRVRLVPYQEPLTDYQRNYVDRFVPMAKRISAIYAKRWPDLSEEFRSSALYALARLGRKVEEPMTDAKEMRFIAYSRQSIIGEMRTIIKNWRHLRGIKMDNRPEVIPLEIDEALGEEVHELAKPDSSYEEQEQASQLMASLPLGERQVLHLMDQRGMTTEECSRVIGCDAWSRRTRALNLVRERCVYDTGVLKHKQPFNPYERLDMPVPRYYLGLVGQLVPRKKSAPCVVCQGKMLRTGEYCLGCDRWGMDYMLGVIAPKQNHQAKQNRSEFIRDFFDKNGVSPYDDVKQAWHQSGHPTELCPTLKLYKFVLGTYNPNAPKKISKPKKITAKVKPDDKVSYRGKKYVHK